MSDSGSHSLEELARAVFEITKVTWLSTQRTKPGSQYDLSETEFLTLDALEQEECLTVGDLQRRIQVLPAQMSRVIKNLETKHDKSLIRCTINAKDKRRVDVRLTEAGASAVEAFRRHKIEMTKSALKGLSARDRENLVRIVRIVRRAIDTLAQR